MKLKVIYCFIGLSLGWVLGGCSDDSEELIAPEKEYVFREVLWKLDEGAGDGMSILEKKEAPYVLSNRTSLTQPFVYARDTIRPLCVFTVPALTSELVGDSVLTLRVPNDTSGISRTSFAPLPFGMSTYDVRFVPQKQELPGSEMVDVYRGTVEPYTQLVCTVTMRYREVHLSYKLLFEETHSGEQLEVEGGWKGYYHVADEVHIDTYPLE